MKDKKPTARKQTKKKTPEPTIIVNMGVTAIDKMQAVKEFLLFCLDEDINPQSIYALILYEEHLLKRQ